MQERQRLFALISVLALLAGPAFAQEGASKSTSTTDTAAGSSPEAGRGPAAGREIQLTELLAQARPQRRAGFGLMPCFSITPMAAGPNLPVLGGGTLGRLTKWTGFTSSNSFVGDSMIFESKEGLVGVGTDSPSSKLTVAGVVQSTSGGFKFPDGTVQTTVGVAATDVVKSLNGLKGDVQLASGSNITIASSGNTLTVAAPNALTTVAHDQSLTGDGTAGNPLRVAQSSQPHPEPVSVTARFTIEAGKSLGGAPLLTVPAGKRLTVEHGSGSCSAPSGQFIWSFELS